MQAILKRILERSARSSDWTPPVSVLATAWPGLVGDQLAEVTRPIDVDWEAGRLTIATVSPTWERELGRRESELLERIDAVLPWSVDELDFETRDSEGSTDGEAGRSPAGGADSSPIPEDRTADWQASGEAEGLEETLDSLPDEAEASARRILRHVRDQSA